MTNSPIRLRFTPKAEKNLKKIKKIDRNLLNSITVALNEISLDPSIGEEKRGDLKGYFCYDVHHLKTNYEICYRLKLDENGEVVLIVMIGTRENFYDDLKRYLNI